MTLTFEHPLVSIAILFVLAYFYLIRRRLLKAAALPLLVRALVIVLLLITLAGPKVGSRLQTTYVYFVVDVSQSTGVEQEQLVEKIEKLARPKGHMRYGLIVFGQDASIEADFSEALKMHPKRFLSVVRTDGTDIAAALRLALDTFPKEGHKEIFLLSDGHATQGELEGVLARAQKEGVRVHTLPISELFTEVWLEELKLPAQVGVGMAFPIKIKISAHQSGRGTLMIERDGKPIIKRPIALERGLNEFELRDKLERPGAFLYRARIDAESDTLPQNNELLSVVNSLEGPQVLLLGPKSDMVEKLLQSSGYIYEVKSLNELSAATLAPYKAIVLNNVSIASLRGREIAALRAYVEGLGGGLFVIQGKEAVEGVLQTEFEEILPVSYTVPQLADIPPLAIVLLLDRSSSMGEYTGGDQKIELLKRAATAAIQQLGEDDLIGVMSFSDGRAWEVELQKVLGEAHKRQIAQKIEGLSAHGGTLLYPALEDAFERLENIRARIKHIVAFSDGKVEFDRSGFAALFEKIRNSTITVSVVAIDEQPDMAFLQQLVDAGKGELYPAKEMRKLPLISLRVARDVTRSRWVEGDIKLEQTKASWLKEFVGAANLPHLEGYVLTYKKETSQTALESEGGDPVLSFWRYGLGKVAVLNTDLEGRWSKRLIQWDQLSKLFAQTLSRVYSEHVPAREEMTIRIERVASRLLLQVDLQEGGQWVNGAQLQGQLLGQSTIKQFNSPTVEQNVDFIQVLPGRYQAEIDDLDEGVYLMKVSAKKGGAELASGTKNIVVPYALEYKGFGLNAALLRQISSTTQGVYITDEEVSQDRIFTQTGFEYRDFWGTSLLIAIVLFIVDLILRKLPLDRKRFMQAGRAGAFDYRGRYRVNFKRGRSKHVHR